MLYRREKIEIYAMVQNELKCSKINIKGNFQSSKVTMATPNHKSVVRDISLTTGLYVKYTLVVSFDLRC